MNNHDCGNIGNHTSRVRKQKRNDGLAILILGVIAAAAVMYHFPQQEFFKWIQLM